MRHRCQPQHMAGDEREIRVTFKERADEFPDLSRGGHQRGFTCVTMIRTVPGKYMFAIVARVRARLRVSLELPVL